MRVVEDAMLYDFERLFRKYHTEPVNHSTAERDRCEVLMSAHEMIDVAPEGCHLAWVSDDPVVQADAGADKRMSRMDIVLRAGKLRAQLGGPGILNGSVSNTLLGVIDLIEEMAR